VLTEGGRAVSGAGVEFALNAYTTTVKIEGRAIGSEMTPKVITSFALGPRPGKGSVAPE